MAIKRYFAIKDNTITNAFKENLTSRATTSNMGASDILEVFSIYGQASSASSELSRVLVQFDTSELSTDRTNSVLPASGSVSFYLKLFNAPHGQTLPKSFTLMAQPVSASWDEGVGLDMELYKDIGKSNWVSASTTAAWTTAGGDYLTGGSSQYVTSQSFDKGTENLEINVTTIVEDWLAGTIDDYGFGVFLSSSLEAASRSYYTKKFFARGTEFFFKRPVLEARWDSSIEDDRGNFFYSSSLATAAENLNTIYLYNYFRGRLRNIPSIGTGSIYVSLFSGSSNDTAPSGSAIALVADGTHVLSASPTVVTGGYVSTGIYSASVALTAAATPIATLYDVWHNGDLTTQFQTGTISPEVLTNSLTAPDDEYVISITNLKPTYRPNETARFRLFTRQKDWNPTIYTRAVATPEVYIVESGSYEIYRVVDDLKVVPYGTGSDGETILSYDASGSYFDLDMSMLESGYMYGINFAFYNQDIGEWVEQPDAFKFKVESERQS